MTDTLLERVARAICESAEADDFDALSPDSIVRALYMQQARAAILAMHEPTEDMAVAYYHVLYQQMERARELGDGTETYPTPAKVWQAMIDAAISHQEQKP